jgi:hypothetical protein
MILSIGQVAGAIALFVGVYLLFGLPVALIAGGTGVLIVCTVAELALTPRVQSVRDARPGGL